MEKKDILELSKLSIDQLKEIAATYKIETTGYAKQSIIYLILDKQAEK